ncbi:hypothetical protein [Dubosiella muris]|uniref:Uncharacterized protein n=1 Tax=Dubosiella muris TaxID=3038133 RepID=A0AC61R7E8_9FIRM|nr:hypothetical protein [Dubosiella muris]TGY66036.1 hypothetical protein E5336_05990 [Dubosiella muris]
MKRFWILLYGWLLNPALNALVFFMIDPSYDNLSYIGNTLHHPLFLWIWAVSSVIGMYWFSKSIWNRYHISYQKFLHLFICAGMPLSCVVPYDPGLPGWVNDIHVWLAIVCVCAFMLEWIVTFFQPVFTLSKAYRQLGFSLMTVFALSFLCLTSAGHVNALCEMAFSVGVNVVLAWSLVREP